MPQVSSAVASHTGLRRPGNEDAYCVRPELGLYVVADGMGGHAAGEVASRLAVDAIASVIAGASDTARAPGQSRDRAQLLTTAFLAANRTLADATLANGALRGMATTAAAVLIDPDGAAVAHVGDSRVYRWRGGQLVALTEDHSWVGEQMRAGVLSDADARRHPWRNVVTRAIGTGTEPAVDVADLALLQGDRVLLCSDGLSAVVSNERIEAILSRGATLQDACDALVDAANDAGGPDNITVMLIQIDVA